MFSNLLDLIGGLYGLIFFTILFLISYLFVLRTWFYFTDRNVKFIRGLPFLGSAYKTILGLESIAIELQKCYENLPNCKIIGLYDAFGAPVFLVRDPEIVRKITITEADQFVRNDILLPSHRCQNDQLLRKLWNKFDDETVLNGFNVHTRKFVRSLHDYVAGSRTYNTKTFVSRYVCDVLASIAFGIELNTLKDAENDFYRAIVELTRLGTCENFKLLLHRRFPQLPVKTAIDNTVSTLQQLICSEIDRRKSKQIVRNDLIDLLIEQNKQDATNQLSDSEMALYCVTFFLDCFVPLTTTACFMFHELAVNPDIQITLAKEITTASDASIDKLKYLEAVLSETLRRWNPLPVVEYRCIKATFYENTNDKKVFIRSGERILIPTYALHMDENHFSAAEKFDPERFSLANRTNIKIGTYLPFGSCKYENKKCVVTLIKTLAFHLLNDFVIDKSFKTQDPLTLKSGLFQLDAEGGFFIDLRQRKRNEE